MERDKTFDRLKGFAMLCVIMGHLYSPGVVKILIYSFHMPLFFIVSGYFLKTADISFHIKKTARSLLAPYIITCLMMLGIRLILIGVDADNILEWVLTSLYGISSQYVPGYHFDIQRVGPIWFLPALFWAEIEWQILQKYNLCLQLICSIILAIAAVVVGHFIWLPLSILNGIVACVFVVVGNCSRHHALSSSQYTDKKIIIVASAVWILCIFLDIIKDAHFSISTFSFPLYGFGMLGAICITLVLCSLFKKLTLPKIIDIVLCRIGCSTLGILCIHAIDGEWIHWKYWGGPLQKCAILLIRVSITIVLGMLFDFGLSRLLRRQHYLRRE